MTHSYAFLVTKALHAFEHLQESPPDSWAFLNQDYLIRHPEANEKVNDLASNTSPSSVTIAGDQTGLKPKKRNGYQSRPVGGPLTPKVDVKKSNVWIVAKKVIKDAGSIVVSTDISIETNDGVALSQVSSEKSTTR